MRIWIDDSGIKTSLGGGALIVKYNSSNIRIIHYNTPPRDLLYGKTIFWRIC